MASTSSPIGELEELALLVVIALGDDAYGVGVQRRLQSDASRSMALGAVYAVLDRLERRGYLRSTLGDATPQRGGRRKRIFEVTPSGLRALKELKRTRELLWRAAEAAGGRG